LQATALTRRLPNVFPVPKDLQRLADQVDGWLDLRAPDKALSLLAPMLADANGRPAGLVLQVRALCRLGDYRAALPALDELRQHNPQLDWIDLTEGWCKKRLADLPGAIAALERLVARAPRHDVARFNLACYLALQGERDRAIDELTLACGINADCRDLARDDPDLDELRTDPRFRMLMRQVGGERPPKMADEPDVLEDDLPADDEDDVDDSGGEMHRRN
jgi:thioredoxin-like negative regulator of GroEL